MSKMIQVENISKSFITSEHQKLLVLDDISFDIQHGEIVAILGKSGSGKSTLLRIIAGLVPASSGSIYFNGELVTKPRVEISMIFQSFALLPWLTVLENVELGLEAQGIRRDLRRKRALKAIDIIGLDGFESAYPKELSGGMRQRVGFARALVVEPELLLMDEPFSALDILTSENLRGDLLDLWQDKATRTKGILIVTHDIEEAILMANRIVIFSSNPGKIQEQISINLPYPRDPQSLEFRELLDQVYSAMTTSERMSKSRFLAQTTREYSYRIPEVDISELIGLLEAMESHEIDGLIELPALAEALHLDVNNLFQLTEVLDMLQFAKIAEGSLQFTESGKQFAAADILLRKQIFAKHLMEHIPLVKHIRRILDNSVNNIANEEQFISYLETSFSEDEASRILRTVIDWGRYAELFAYDYDSGELSLENPQ